MGEVEVGLELLADRLMPGEFPAVVGRDGMYVAAMWLEQLDHGIADRLCRFTLYLANQIVAGLAFDQADDGLLVVHANDRICLPVADPATLFDNGWALLDGLAIGDDASPVGLAVALSA